MENLKITAIFLALLVVLAWAAMPVMAATATGSSDGTGAGKVTGSGIIIFVPRNTGAPAGTVASELPASCFDATGGMSRGTGWAACGSIIGMHSVAPAGGLSPGCFNAASGMSRGTGGAACGSILATGSA